MLSRSVLADLNSVSDRLAHTQHKLSSGREVNKPSDDPFRANRALSLRSDLEGVQQSERNVNEAIAWNDATDGALSSVNDIIQRARELLLQGANDTSSQVARDSVASEIVQLVEGAKQHIGATYAGRFLFSGTQTGTRPYALGGADTFSGDAQPIAREIGPGVSVQVNVIGSDILGNGQAAGDNKLLDVLRDVADDLRTGTPAALAQLRGSDLQRLDTNLDELSRIRAQAGAVGSRLESAQMRLGQLEETTTKLLSDTEDADMAKTLVDYSTQKAVYQSALHSGADVIQMSLLDFLR